MTPSQTKCFPFLSPAIMAKKRGKHEQEQGRGRELMWRGQGVELWQLGVFLTFVMYNHSNHLIPGSVQVKYSKWRLPDWQTCKDRDFLNDFWRSEIFKIWADIERDEHVRRKDKFVGREVNLRHLRTRHKGHNLQVRGAGRFALPNLTRCTL